MRRALFYLGQTFRDLGRPDLAADYYRQRVEAGGWSEEVFYANFQEGVSPARIGFRGRGGDPAGGLGAAADQGRARCSSLPARTDSRVPGRGPHVREPRPADQYPDDVLLSTGRPRVGARLERALAASDLGRLEEARADLLALLREADLPRPTERFVSRTLANLREPVPGRPVRDRPG